MLLLPLLTTDKMLATFEKQGYELRSKPSTSQAASFERRHGHGQKTAKWHATQK